MNLRVPAILFAIIVFALPGAAQETETYDIYGITYTIPVYPKDEELRKAIDALSPELRAKIQEERREMIYKFLRAATITNPNENLRNLGSRIRDRFVRPTNDVWLEESRMLTEYGGYFQDRYQPVGLKAISSAEKLALESTVTLLNNKIWATAKIRGQPDSRDGNLSMYFFNLGGGLWNKVRIPFTETQVRTSVMLFRSFAAYKYYDPQTRRTETKLYFHRQWVDTEKAGQLFFGSEVGARFLKVYTKGPGLPHRGTFISFPLAPVTMDSNAGAGIGFNLSLNVVSDLLVLMSAVTANPTLGSIAAASQVLSKVGLVQTTFENEYIGETKMDVLRWISRKLGNASLQVVNSVMPPDFQFNYFQHKIDFCAGVLN